MEYDEERRQKWQSLYHPGKDDQSYDHMLNFATEMLKHIPEPAKEADAGPRPTSSELANAMQVMSFNGWQNGPTSALLMYLCSLPNHSCLPNAGSLRQELDSDYWYLQVLKQQDRSIDRSSSRNHNKPSTNAMPC